MANRRKTKRVLSPIAAARRRQKRAWTVAGLSVAALVIVTGALAQRGPNGHHPTPRPVAQEPDVVSYTRYASYPRVADTYRMAAAVPSVLDGIYCYCHCHENMGHYSLLDCYTSDHAAECDVCLSEGAMVYQLHKQGKDLNTIRAQIDKTFGA